MGVTARGLKGVKGLKGLKSLKSWKGLKECEFWILGIGQWLESRFSVSGVELWDLEI